mgnify:CR=1 FL=1
MQMHSDRLELVRCAELEHVLLIISVCRSALALLHYLAGHNCAQHVQLSIQFELNILICQIDVSQEQMHCQLEQRLNNRNSG